jgi:oligopeptide/dipeptide ABC transporter ATP-binding protein
MYMGRIVEEAAVGEIFNAPLHPYTRGLMDSIPRIGEKLRGDKQPLREIKGVVPSLLALPKGCTFSDRCGRTMEICRRSEPELAMIRSVRLGLGDVPLALDRTAGRFVQDGDLLAEGFLGFGRYDADGVVHRTARSERDHDLEETGGERFIRRLDSAP